MIDSEERELKLLLQEIEQRIKPLLDQRSWRDGEVSSTEVFEGLPAAFQARVRALAFFDAIREIDRRAANQYWFLRLLAVSLILTRTLPLEKDDVLTAVLRERKIYCLAGDVVLLDKVMNGKWAELTAVEETRAISDGLFLVAEPVAGRPKGIAPFVNHVYSLA
jgi:hypothetical protein